MNDPNWIIGALALITIGGVLALSVFHFGFYLKDPENLEATKQIAKDRESATTRMAAEGTGGRSLRQRLDEAPGVSDRLSSRPTGLSPWDAAFHAKWSEVRTAVGENPRS